jgi:hypothetical protein
MDLLSSKRNGFASAATKRLKLNRSQRDVQHAGKALESNQRTKRTSQMAKGKGTPKSAVGFTPNLKVGGTPEADVIHWNRID